MKQLWLRRVCALLVFAMILSMLPMTVFAADVNTGVTGLTAASSGSASWSNSGGTIKGSVDASASSGCSGTTYTAQTGTLTFTNSSGAVALLSFDYSLTLSGGSATIDGANVAAGAGFSKKLAAGETVAVSITSPGAEGTTSIEISNLKLTAEQNVSITFKASSHGSYTVDGTAVTTDTTVTKLTTDTVSLAATPASGYKFFGWYSETTGNFFSTTATLSTSFTSSQTVYPVFVSSSSPVFQVGTKLFTDLNEAISYSQSSGIAKIVLISNGTLPAGNYTIPSGKTLLIPFDDAQTVYITTPEVIYGTHENPSAFRTLTMAEDAKITVANGGTLSVPSKLCATGTGSGSWNGTPTGKHGRITMNTGSSIDVQSGGVLSSFGYISGSGNIYARSGSTIWECFQIRCWRGGTAVSGMADNAGRVFPLNQYYVQNIEAPLTLYPGATEKVYTAVNMSSKAFAASATFVGSGGMFQVDSGSVTKRFTGASDRLELSVDGTFRVTPMSLTIAGLPLIGTLDLNTADYTLPIQSNITINVNSGTTTINQDVCFMPGAEMIIANGATATIASGKKAYVYDKDQWGAYAAAGLQLVPVGYSTVNGATAKRTAASLVDAKIDVNGTLTASGALYTTQSGAAIVSSAGTGKVILTSNPGTETKTYQATQSGSDMTYVEIPITAAKLQNADGTYVETAEKPAGTEIPYVSGVWGGTAQTYTVIWLGEDGSPLQEEQLENGEHPVYKGLLPTKDEDGKYTYDFDKWMIAETDEEYTDATVVNGADMTLYPVFTATRKTLTVTFHANNGTDETATQTMNTVEETALEANTFTFPSHKFLGWATNASGEKVYDDKQRVEFDGNVDLYAVWERETITVSFDANASDAVGTMKPATLSVHGGPLPANGFSREGYIFDSWNTVANGSGSRYEDQATFSGDEDITLYAQWVKVWTITFLDSNNQPISSQTVRNGEMPTVPDGPEKKADAQYTYTFKEWSPAVGPATADATYTPTYNQTINTYTITWYIDGIIETETYQYGAIPSHADPEKEGDAQYSYTFTGWVPDIAVVTGDATYNAAFEPTLKKYTITFQDYNGAVLQSTEVEYGTVPTAPADPTRASTEQYDYMFAGWDQEIVAVTGPATYTATYTSTVRSYDVTWIIDGASETEPYEYGETPSHAEPSKEPDAQYTYSFTGWDPEIVAVTGPATYTAKFEGTLRSYSVKFLNEDGTEVKSETLDYGTTITAPADPTKENTPEKVYTFLGWFTDDDLAVQWTEGTTVTGEVTYKAKFSEADQFYTVIWLDGDGSELGRAENVLYNQIPPYTGEKQPTKEATAQYTYEFSGDWEPALNEETFTYTLTPKFYETLQQYTVTFVIGDQYYPVPYVYGDTPAFDGTPEKASDAQYTYTFTGWSPEIAPVTGDATYTAVFEGTLRSYTVTWVIDGVEETQTYQYGTTPSHADPEKDGDAQYTYTFTGWRPEITTVTGDATYTAQFDQTVNTYLIKFVDEDGTVLDTKTIAYGDIPATDVVPTKNDTITKTYTFAGWADEIGTVWNELPTVTGEATYKATYTETERSGWVSFEGKLYYIVDGAPLSGIARLPYPDDAGLGYAENPEDQNDANYPNDGKSTFIFDENGVLQSDVNGFFTFLTAKENAAYPTAWLADGAVVWAVNGEILWHPGEVKVDGDYYYFASANNMIKGRDYNVTRVHDLQLRGRYTFNDEGKVMMYDGITNVNGTDYYYVNGVKTYAGLIKIGDDLYYINSACEVVKNRSYYVSKTNGLLPAGMYNFDADGKLIVDAPTKNGIVKETETDWYYYVDGVKVYAGLIEIDDSLYYVNSAFQVIHGRDYYVSKTNGLKPQGTYTFDAEGKLVEKDTTLNGIVKDGDTWYYYVDGIKTYAGLVEIDGAFYYVKTDKTVVHGQEYYVSKTNDLKPAGKYTFDDDGKLLELDGIVKDGDVWTYYANGVKMYAGLIEINGALYYVKSDCTVVHSAVYYVSKTNGLKPAGNYSFDEDGKLVELDGIVKNEDVWTYYVNGAKTYAGLIEIDGSYYYVKSDCTVVHGQKYYVSKTNDLLPAGFYTFDVDGKMV